MKRPLLLLFLWMVTSGIATGQTTDLPKIDLSSVDAFFEIASQLREGTVPDDPQWESLYATKGISVVYPTDEYRHMLRQIMQAAFDPAFSARRDSLLATGDRSHGMLLLANYTAMQDHWDNLLEFRDSYDFDQLVPAAAERLLEFLQDPVPEAVEFSAVSLLCYLLDGHSIFENITLDFHLAYIQTDAENIGFIAHEMFHTYRYNLQGKAYNAALFKNPLLSALEGPANEGIADLIDKDDVPEYFRRIGVNQESIRLYERDYADTRGIFQRLDSLTIAYLDGEMTEEAYAGKLHRYFLMNGHANGLYASRVIIAAGLYDQLIENVWSPCHYFRLYQKAAGIQGEYRFSDRFMQYLEALEDQLPEPALRQFSETGV